MNEKPMWIQAILEAKAKALASRGHGGYPDPTPKDESIITVKTMPGWWGWDPNAQDSGEVEDLNITINKKCLHKNTQVVLLLFSSVTECKDCGEKVEP